jgi:hypothetical protein
MATSMIAALAVKTQSTMGGGESGRMRVVSALRQSEERRYYGRYGDRPGGLSWWECNRKNGEDESRGEKREKGETQEGLFEFLLTTVI